MAAVKASGCAIVVILELFSGERSEKSSFLFEVIAEALVSSAEAGCGGGKRAEVDENGGGGGGAIT